ncbi:MAG: hypothetical protein FWF46_09250 [Oscillospiraceae bacterium]|nr:hypothetical protein [Oscillospiraceae bacterium]
MNDIYDNPIDWDEIGSREREISSSRFCIGRYEILSTTMPYLDENGEYDGYSTHRVIQEINGADVKYFDTGLKYYIDWKEKRKSINSISFTMPSDDAKLGHIFVTSPYGLIKKNRTGIGATTLELESPRNSIVVVPTKALAITKAKKSKIEGTEKYKHLYVSAESINSGFQSISDYLSDSSIEYKKFIVVADSLPKVLREIGEENYPLYFLMVDEIDSYQYDSSYRDSLENVIDYYFKFPESKRCLVSATIGKFSNQKIKDEPVINVNFNDPQPRNINLLHTNNIIWTAVKQILYIRREHPDDKILIAYNTVKGGILQIIESIRIKLKKQLIEQGVAQVDELVEAQLRNECAVLCSVQSKRKVPSYYSDIEGELLPKKINFMTCAYFVGIDISERFHLISIADSSIPFTLLSEDKFLQIAGRCRNSEGLLSETIIYQSSQMECDDVVEIDLINDFDLEAQIKNDASSLVNYANILPDIAETFPLLQNEQSKEDFDNIIIKSSKKGYYGTAEVKLVRKNIDGIIQPAYLNIDNIIIQYNLLYALYSSIDKLRQSLAQHNNVTFRDIREVNPQRISITIRRKIESEIMEAEQIEMNEIIEHLRPAISLDERIWLANDIKRNLNLTKNGQLFLERYLELQELVPFDELMLKLKEHQYDDEYDKFYDSVIFWALSDEHPFKIAFREKFSLNTYMTSEQVIEKLNELLMSNLGLDKLDKIQTARKHLNILCVNERRRHRELVNAWFIKSYDVNDFNTTPLFILPATVEIHKKFRFIKK